MQNWEKGCVSGHIDKFWKGHDGQIKKNACKNEYLGSIFIPEKYVIRVLFVCPWMGLLPFECPPPPPGFCCMYFCHLHVNKVKFVSVKSVVIAQNTLFKLPLRHSKFEFQYSCLKSNRFIFGVMSLTWSKNYILKSLTEESDPDKKNNFRKSYSSVPWQYNKEIINQIEERFCQ